MKYQCPSCQVAFTAPDEKIPEGRALKVLCPRCKAPLELRGKEAHLSGGAAAETPDAPPVSGYEYAHDDSSQLDVVEEGTRTALVCIIDEQMAGRIATVLRQLEFFVVVASKAAFAVSKLRHNHYDVVVLDERFDASGPTQNLVLHHIQLLPMHVRRQFFLCLLSETLPTMDQMTAFRLGADMTLNVRDLDKTKIILVRAMNDHKAFYRTFNDELRRKGQI